MKILIQFLLLSFSTSTWAQSETEPCEWFDHNGDGYIGHNTWVYTLGQFGTNGEMDVDSSGFVDMRDLLAFMPFFGELCPVDWFDSTSNHILGLALVEAHIHTEALVGLDETGNIPEGSVTYHLYAQMSESTDEILAVYGDDQSPLTLETSGSFFGFGSEPLNTVVISDYNSTYNNFSPTNPFSTWLSVGIEASEETTTAVLIINDEQDWNEMGNDGFIQFSDSIGGAWFLADYVEFGSSGMLLLGQFTVTGTSNFQGTINLLAKTNNGDNVEQAEGMSFSSDNLAVFGCTDPEAGNYNPDATHEPIGVCLNPGDFNGDGEYTSSDLLELIGLFGCLDCGMGDLNGDGVFTVQDLLVFLSL